MEALLQNLHPVAALVLGLLVLAWVTLMFMVPFMIEGIRTWTRKTHQELEQVNRNLERLNALLSRSAGEPPPADSASSPAPEVRTEPRTDPATRRPPATPRTRKEPVISDHVPLPDDHDREPRISAGLRRSKGR